MTKIGKIQTQLIINLSLSILLDEESSQLISLVFSQL